MWYSSALLVTATIIQNQFKPEAKDIACSKVSYDLSRVPSPTIIAVSSTAQLATITKPSASPPVVNELTLDIDTIVSNLGLKGNGVNSKTANGALWIGGDSVWKTHFINNASGNLVLFCWEFNEFQGMVLNVNLPAISVVLKQGESVTISFAAGVPAACAPAFSDTKLAIFGGIDNTWYEATFGASGVFDISRVVNMNGNSVSARGSKCLSDMTSCVFKCIDLTVSSCQTGYDLFGETSAGCGGGYDPIMQGTGGGCSMGATGETVNVVFT